MPTENEMHVSDELLELYALGRLPEDQVAPLEEHLLVCPACQDRLAETDAYVEAARQAAHNFMMLPPSRWQLLWARLAAWMDSPIPAWTAVAAATVALVLFLVPRLVVQPDPQGTAVTVLLQTARGVDLSQLTRAPAGRPLRLSWDAVALPEGLCCRVELVDAGGRVILRRQLGVTDSLRTAALPAGRYWVRLYGLDPEARLLREFGLHVE